MNLALTLKLHNYSNYLIDSRPTWKRYETEDAMKL